MSKKRADPANSDFRLLWPETGVFISGEILKMAGGAYRDRTDDPLLAKQVLSQLSYTPVYPHAAYSGGGWWVWLDSNQRPPPYQDGALTD